MNEVAITIVTGAPCSGKSTYIQQNKKTNDIVIDLDLISKALGGTGRYIKGEIYNLAQLLRKEAINKILDGINADAWIIHTQPNTSDLAKYKLVNATLIEVDPGIEVCLSRAKQDGRVGVIPKIIKQWYAKRDKTQLEPEASWRTEKKTANQRGYNYKWKKARDTFLSRPGNQICAYCKSYNRIEVATVVDHIIPHKGDTKLFWDTKNWQPLCKRCHNSTKQKEENNNLTSFDEKGNPVDGLKHWK